MTDAERAMMPLEENGNMPIQVLRQGCIIRHLPVHYMREHELFKDAYATELTDSFAKYVYLRLRRHYHFQQALYFSRRRGGVCYESRIILCNSPSAGVLCHEVAHALHQIRYGYTRKHHTKRFLSLMRQVLKYYQTHETKWHQKHTNPGHSELNTQKELRSYE